MIRVLIADDHNLVRQGIRALIESGEGVRVVAEAADGLEAFEKARIYQPQVVLMDIGMPRLGGLQALERIQRELPEVQVVILSMHADESLIRQVLRNGARGYLLKDSLKEELTLAIHAAARGEVYLSPAVSNLLVEDYLNMPEVSSNPLDGLTPREREVLKLIAEGNTNAAVAGLLYISVKTVEKHRANLMSKLGVSDTAALVRLAIQYNLIYLE